VTDTCEDVLSETAEVVGISSLQTYISCKNTACYKKKLVNNICPTCSKNYTGETEITSVVCNVLINQEEEYRELTLFTSQVEEITQKPLSPEKKAIEDDLLSVIPVRIKYVSSPKKDNTVSKLKRY